MLTWLRGTFDVLRPFVAADFLAFFAVYSVFLRLAQRFSPRNAAKIAYYGRWTFMVLNVAFVAWSPLKTLLWNPNPFDSKRGAYSLLNVSPSAPQKLISRSYKLISSNTHPDKATGDHDTHVLVSTANSLLKDERLRFMYDRVGSMAVKKTYPNTTEFLLTQLVSLALVYATKLAAMFPPLLFTRPAKELWMVNFAATVLAGTFQAMLLTRSQGHFLEIPTFQWTRIVDLLLVSFLIACRWLLVAPVDPVLLQAHQTAQLATDYDMLLSGAVLQTSQPFKQDVKIDAKAKAALKSKILQTHRLTNPETMQLYVDTFRDLQTQPQNLDSRPGTEPEKL